MAKAFAEAYLHFAEAVKFLEIKKKEVFLELKKKFFVKEKKISFIKKTFLQDTNYLRASIFIIHTFISYIFNSLLLVRYIDLLFLKLYCYACYALN